jgi:hypothetical protein
MNSQRHPRAVWPSPRLGFDRMIETRRFYRLTAFVLAAIFGTLQAAATGATRDPGYLRVEAASVSYFQWVNNGGAVTGQLHIATLASDNQVVESHVLTFTGEISEGAITINFGQSIFGAGTTIVGSVNGAQLTLNTSTSSGYIAKTQFVRASVDDYNAAVGRLQTIAAAARAEAAQAAAAQQATAQREAAFQQMQGAVSNASSDLESTLSSLASDERSALNDATFDSDFKEYELDLAGMDRDYQTEQKDAGVSPFTCTDLGAVNVDVGSIDVDLGSIHTDDGSYRTHKSSIGVDIGELNRDLVTANVQLVALRTAVDNDTTGDIPQHISGLDASHAISVAQQTVRIIADRMASADQQIQKYDQQAQSKDDQAHELAAGLRC